MGFFNIQKVDPKAMKSRSCVTCGLHKHATTPKMWINGEGRKKILILGTASNEVEDRKGTQWSDRTGRVFAKELEKLGIDLRKDCWSLNALGCLPIDKKGIRKPTSSEISCCRKRVKKAINQLKPTLILAMGVEAVESLIGDRWLKKLNGIQMWRGWAIPDRVLETRICPLFHPAHVARELKGDKTQVRTIFRNDLKNALTYLDKPFKFYEDESQYIQILTTPETIRARLKKICQIRNHILSFDYETTGLKPQLSRHIIVCMSIAVSPTECYSFPIHTENLPEIRRFLRDSRIWKSAFNMKYENNWSNGIFKVDVNGWKWDSMLAAHILDNRAGVKGLKFQSYVNYGIMGYDEEISPYLKATDKKNANAYNGIQRFIAKYGIEKVLIYCGLDSIYENMLGTKQRTIMGFE